jgi:hypothetical protein
MLNIFADPDSWYSEAVSMMAKKKAWWTEMASVLSRYGLIADVVDIAEPILERWGLLSRGRIMADR